MCSDWLLWHDPAVLICSHFNFLPLVWKVGKDFLPISFFISADWWFEFFIGPIVSFFAVLIVPVLCPFALIAPFMSFFEVVVPISAFAWIHSSCRIFILCSHCTDLCSCTQCSCCVLCTAFVPVSAPGVFPAVAFLLCIPKAKALEWSLNDSLILCAPPLLTVALSSLDEDEELYENSHNTYYASSLLPFCDHSSKNSC